MLDANQKEKKCVRYLANEMSKAERCVFEIELSLDHDLRDIFERFRMIWFSYPNSEIPKETISFDQIIKKYNKEVKTKPLKRKRKDKLGLAVASFLVVAVFFYLIGMPHSEYTNHRIAGKGERLTFILPDSSTVVLNSGAEIKYANDFGKQRDIWLKGEAFFKVTKNPNSPFIVHTTDFDVKVLGTEFNVNSTAINQTVSLAKGKVNVLFNESKDEINLIPNEELVWNAKTKSVIKRNFDVNSNLAWKDNILLLNDVKLKEALPRINQFYGVRFIIDNPAIGNQHIRGAFKDQTINEFITSLEFILEVNIKKTDHNNIIITKKHEK